MNFPFSFDTGSSGGNGGNGGNGGEVDPADELVGFMLGMGSVSDNKEEKMRTFQSVCGFDEEQALFYLEANSWNVDLAVSSFFANQQAAPVVIEYHLAAMATDHDQTQTVEGGEVFSKSWKLANTGTRAWPTGCYVSLHTGDPHGAQPIELPGEVPAGADVDFSLQFEAPAEPGVYTAAWRMYLPNGQPFGDYLHVKFVVRGEQSQQLATFGGFGGGSAFGGASSAGAAGGDESGVMQME
ncbi:uncharacterized protein AMSG_01019, partial [Thecamonas trahens ATCC 50062]